MQGALLVDRDGKIINEMSGDAFGHRTGEDVEIVRSTLCQILMDRILPRQPNAHPRPSYWLG
jgi:hypothetical protein